MTVTIVGTGALAKNLFRAIENSNGAIVQGVLGRNAKSLIDFKSTNTSTDFSAPIRSDIVLLAVSDPALKEVYLQLKSNNSIFAHCAGSVPLSVFENTNNTGVFYPLQTFNNKSTVSLSQVPIGIESDDEYTFEQLEKLAKGISSLVIPLPSEKRKQLHLAAVFANNFSNHLFSIAQEICLNNGLSVDLLAPLIEQTSKNVCSFTASEIQSGPAKRNDQKRIQEHLQLLNDPSHKEIYQLLSDAIQKKYANEL